MHGLSGSEVLGVHRVDELLELLDDLFLLALFLLLVGDVAGVGEDSLLGEDRRAGAGGERSASDGRLEMVWTPSCALNSSSAKNVPSRTSVTTTRSRLTPMSSSRFLQQVVGHRARRDDLLEANAMAFGFGRRR